MDPHASRPAGLPARTPNSAYAAAIGMTIAFGLSCVATKYALEVKLRTWAASGRR